MKTRLFKTKNIPLKFHVHHPLHHIPLPKIQKELICRAKVIEGPEAPVDFIDRVVFKCHSDSVLFMFFIDRILFRVFSNKFFSWVINALFRPCRYFFIQSCCYFFIKNRWFVLHSLYILKNN